MNVSAVVVSHLGNFSGGTCIDCSTGPPLNSFGHFGQQSEDDKPCKEHR